MFKFFFICFLLSALIFGTYITTGSDDVQPKKVQNFQVYNDLVEDIQFHFPDLGAGVHMMGWFDKRLELLEKKYDFDVTAMIPHGAFLILYATGKEVAREAGYLDSMTCQHRNFDHKNILQMIAFFGDIETFSWLVENRDMDVNMLNCHNESLAHYAAKGGHFDIVRYLVEKTDFNRDLLNLQTFNSRQGSTVLDINLTTYEIDHPQGGSKSRSLNSKFIKKHGGRYSKEIMYSKACLSQSDRGYNYYKYAANPVLATSYKSVDYSCKFALRQLENRISKTTLEESILKRDLEEKALVLAELNARGFDEWAWERKKTSIEIL